MIERIEINLLPAEYRVHRKKFRVKREVAYPLLTAGVIAAGLTLFSLILSNNNRISRNEADAIQQTINQNRPIQNEINQLRRDRQTIEQKIHALELIDVSREKWVRLMEELSNRLPDYTWLISIKEEMNVPPVIHIEGRTHSFPEVANFMSNLKECGFIQSVDLSEIEQISNRDRVFKFSISCAINADAYMTTGQQYANGTVPQ